MSAMNFKRTKLACYSSYFTMSSVFSFPPLLFVVFKETYGISYTLLGTLILLNFCTQMAVDLIFTVFSKKFNIKKTLRAMPVITSVGFFVYALVPLFAPQAAYLGLAIGTVIFSVSAGLSEVLLSPLIAAIPSDNPQREMSFLHSLYAFGVLTVVVLTTVYFKIFSRTAWVYLALFYAALPIVTTVLFCLSPMPPLDLSADKTKKNKASGRVLGLAFCSLIIFFGSCAENVMSSWISGYMETALSIDKSVGDILGTAAFAVLLGLTRILYAKFGKNIAKMLLFGLLGAVVCYLVTGLSSSVTVSFIACILTGIAAAMLWPGTLILMEENVASPGVAAYALLATCGDLGASVAPQLMGVLVDGISASEQAAKWGATLGISAEQLGLKVGMLTTAIFPLIGVFVLFFAVRYFKKQRAKTPDLKTALSDRP